MKSIDAQTSQLGKHSGLSPIDNLAWTLSDLSRQMLCCYAKIDQLVSKAVKVDDLRAQLESVQQRLTELRSNRDELLPQLLSVVSELATKICSLRNDQPFQVEEIVVEANTHIVQKIHNFHIPSADCDAALAYDEQLAQEPDPKVRPSYFLAWAKQVIHNMRISYFRANISSFDKAHRRDSNRDGSDSETDSNPKSIPISKLGYRIPQGLLSCPESRLETDAIDYRSRECQPAKPTPCTFTLDEEHHLSRLSDRCRQLFLFSTDMFQFLSQSRQTEWRAAQVSPIESSELSAVGRAARFALNMAEEKFLSQKNQLQHVDLQIEFHAIHRRIANSCAQDLNRHFWKFCRLNTTWQWLFRFIEPWGETTLQSMDRDLDLNLLAVYLINDVLLGCESADQAFGWLDRHVINDLNSNFSRIACLPTFQSSGSKSPFLNQLKWDAVRNWLKLDTELDTAKFLAFVLDDTCDSRTSDLVLLSSRFRDLLDLPMPFERCVTSKGDHNE